MRALLPLAVCALAVLGAAAPARAADTVDLIVGREPGLSAAERADLRADAGVEFERGLPLDHAEIVTVPAGRAAAALAELRADPDVRWAQRDGLVYAQAGTADPFFPYLWGLENTGRTIQGLAGVPDADMDVAGAWQTATGEGVTVAVVDTGVDASHPDLAGRLALNPGETGDGRETNGLDDDLDGLVDDWRGYDFAYGDNDPDDVDGHGSHVAGTIAAANGNAMGVTGVAPDARILAVKALDDTGTGTWSAIASAFDHAADAGARIVNASLGAPDYAPAIDAAVARHPNTLFVVAAGNDGLDLGRETYYPCESVSPNVICVGASDNRDTRAAFSNYGPSAVDVFAPGVSVLSTMLGDYWWLGGTSMAAPHVAGTAALLLSADPTLTAAELKAAILDSAEPKQALVPYGRGGGRANAAAALDAIAGNGAAGPGEAPVQLPLAAPAVPVADPAEPVTSEPVAEPAQPDAPPAEPDAPPAEPDAPQPEPSSPEAPVTAPTPPAATPSAPVAVPATPAPPAAAPRTVVAPALRQIRLAAAPGRRLVARMRVTQAATVSVVVRRRTCGGGHCTFHAVARGSTAAVGTMSIRTGPAALAPGRYRVTVAAVNAAGRASRTLDVTVARA